MLKKPSVLLSSYGSIQSFYNPHHLCVVTSPSPSPSQLQETRTVSRPSGRRKPQWRGYADVRSAKPSSNRSDDLQWPDLPSATSVPTPYQIFQQKKGAPYSKRRFYELVKLYHPDRYATEQDPSSPDFLSHAVRLERYRLVVAANDILSNPAKRGAYDRYGAGWNGQPELGAQNQNWGQAAGSGWSGFQDNASPAQNATWEDWERWYQRDAKGKQEPLYFSNSAFISLIAICAALAGIGQATRVGDYSRTFLEQIEAVHEDCSKDIQRRRKESLGFVGQKDERIQSFLKNRDASGYAIPDTTDGGYRKLLPAPGDHVKD
ncbi:hypothetical protein MMC08_002923 [Hypocenomyce scalaris]|nr:hypothetical protein [Hypocenomyce scalaris]